jgi:undecaprenyl-diphosphatase
VALSDPHAWPRLRRVLAVTAPLATLAFVVVTALVLAAPEGTALDLWLAPRLVDLVLASPALEALGRLIDVFGGNVGGVTAVVVVSIVLVLTRHRLLAAYLLASGIGGVVLCTTVKYLVDRPRPPTLGLLLDESTPSYPSGHATSGITVWVALGVVALVALGPRVRWWVAVPLFVLGPVVGISRVAMGVHWPTDVLGGWALGSAWTSVAALVVVVVAMRRFGPRQQQPH